jgi:hypothetical protein
VPQNKLLVVPQPLHDYHLSPADFFAFPEIGSWYKSMSIGSGEEIHKNARAVNQDFFRIVCGMFGKM